MHSFLPTEQTTLLVFFNLCLILLVYTLMKKALRHPHIVASSNRRTTIILIFAFILFSFCDTDWFHYLRVYPLLVSGFAGHMEEIYVWIAQNLSIDYLTFRFIVWGGGFILFLYLIKFLPIKTDLVILVFSSIWIAKFSYARASLAMVILYFGIILLLSKGRNLVYALAGLLIIASSAYFHKSTFFGIALVIIAFLSMLMKPKYFISLFILSVPIIVYILKGYIGDFLLMDATEEGVMGDMARGQGYFGEEEFNRGIGPTLGRFLEFSPYYLVAFISLKLVYSNIKSKIYQIPKEIMFLMRYVIIGVIISSVFFFNLGFGDTSLIAGRFLRFFAIPSAIVLAYLIEHKIFYGLSKKTFYIGFIGLLYAVTYSMYCAFVGQ